VLDATPSHLTYLCYVPTFRAGAPLGVVLYEIHRLSREGAVVPVPAPKEAQRRVRQAVPPQGDFEERARQFLKGNPDIAGWIRAIAAVLTVAAVVVAILAVINPIPGDEVAAAYRCCALSRALAPERMLKHVKGSGVTPDALVAVVRRVAWFNRTQWTLRKSQLAPGVLVVVTERSATIENRSKGRDYVYARPEGRICLTSGNQMRRRNVGHPGCAVLAPRSFKKRAAVLREMKGHAGDRAPIAEADDRQRPRRLTRSISAVKALRRLRSRGHRRGRKLILQRV
jgi:hypothetical protein